MVISLHEMTTGCEALNISDRAEKPEGIYNTIAKYSCKWTAKDIPAFLLPVL